MCSPTTSPHHEIPRKVLVSGANGYTATWIVRVLLEHGHSVRGTVRSVDVGQWPKKYFKNYAERFEIVIVEDMRKEGAFDEAVKGVDIVVHTASPVNLYSHLPEDMIDSAVKGISGILESILKFGNSTKRVVFTSSASALLRTVTSSTTFQESDWNFECLKDLEQKGDGSTDLMKYRASKTLAEQYAWKFTEEHQDEISWDLVVLNPTIVLGPTIQEAPSPSSLNTTARWFYDYVTDPVKSQEVGDQFLALAGSAWVDVRDVAEAHRLALEKKEAGGKRIIISAAPFKWQDFIDITNAINPPFKLSKPLPKGNLLADVPHPRGEDLYIFENARSTDILGLKYRSAVEMVRDTLADYETRGW